MSISGGVGLSVRTLREAVGLSLEGAATVLGRDPVHLKRIEEGTGYASEEKLANISGGLAQWVVDGSPALARNAKKELRALKTRTWNIRPCTRPGCVEPSHEWVDGEQDGMCVCVSIVVPFEGLQRELITGYYREGNEAWGAYAEIELTEALQGRSGLAHLEHLTRAFKQVQAQCDELNNTERAAL